MTIKYEEYALLEFFCGFPEVLDEIAEVYQYFYRDKVGHIFSLYISTFDDIAVLKLKHKKLKDPLFSLCLEDVYEIEADKEKLTVIDAGKPFVQVRLRPSITFKFLNL